MKQRINADQHGFRNPKAQKNGRPYKLLLLSVIICVNPLLLFSCSTKPTDIRTLAPADSLIYLETNDLAAALQPIVDSKPFNEVAKTKPDFSALKGVQLAVAVTGFETSEEKISEEQSVGRVQPHFVAIADTHAWNYQAVAFAEKKLGSFVENIYNSQPTLEKTDKHGGKYFTWTAADGDKSYALVIDSVIYFANDESSIEKCLAVRRGESLSIAKTERVLPADAQTLASGYVSTDGIAQIANIVGLQLASEASDEPEVQSAIADIVPQLLRKSITDISWTASKTEQGIEDRYFFSMPSVMANLFNEKMTPSEGSASELLDVLPQSATKVTIYEFRDVLVVWQSLLSMARKQLSPSAEPIISPFAEVLLEPYGIDDPERFIASVGPAIIIANDADDGQKPIIVAPIVHFEDLKASIAKDTVVLKNDAQANFDNDILAVSYINGRVHLGDANTVAGAIENELRSPDERKPYLRDELSNSTAPITTYFYEDQIAAQIKDIFELTYQGENDRAGSKGKTETRFTKTGMERKTISDFGLIGSIIAQMAQD
ncbi:MAG: hypothetical protein ACKVRN_07665 [Pyrinomonadaceae bacterium]